MMKKIACLLLIFTLMLCVSSCQEKQDPPTQNIYSFVYEGQTLSVHSEAQAVLSALGAPLAYSEIPPCGRGDLDKSYQFGSFTVQTYQENGVDYFSVINLKDDLVATKEGVSIGNTQQRVLDTYGEPTSKKMGTMEIWSYASGEKADGVNGMDLEFYFDVNTKTVKEIVYRSWN